MTTYMKRLTVELSQEVFESLEPHFTAHGIKAVVEEALRMYLNVQEANHVDKSSPV